MTILEIFPCKVKNIIFTKTEQGPHDIERNIRNEHWERGYPPSQSDGGGCGQGVWFRWGWGHGDKWEWELDRVGSDGSEGQMRVGFGPI